MTTQHEEQGEEFEREAVIPASCPRHPQLSTVLVRKLPDGEIHLWHSANGCILTLPAGPLFDVLGEWLG